MRKIAVISAFFIVPSTLIAGPRVDDAEYWTYYNKNPVISEVTKIPASGTFEETVHSGLVQYFRSNGVTDRIQAVQMAHRVKKVVLDNNKEFKQNVLWGKLAEEFVKGVIIEYGIRAVDELVKLGWSVYQEKVAEAEARDSATRQRIIRELSDGDISNGEFDYVGPHPNDNTASPMDNLILE
jgi:hypothetical protein